MKQLSKEEKLTAYSFAYLSVLSGMHALLNYGYPCVCDSLSKCVYCLIKNYWQDTSCVLDYFPEFAKQKPKGKRQGEYWWDTDPSGNLSRLRAIERAIRIVEKSKV